MIIFAYNSYSDYSKSQDPTACIDPIKASDAHKSQKYYCAYCGCEMHTCTRDDGVSWFVCYKGVRHTGAVCSQLAQNSNRTIIDTDIANFDIDKFFEKIMKERMSTRYMAAVAMFSAVSFLAVLLAKVIPNVAGFLSYEPKDAIIVIAGLLYGIAQRQHAGGDGGAVQIGRDVQQV